MKNNSIGIDGTGKPKKSSESNFKKSISSVKDLIQAALKETKNMSYEESLCALDLTLEKLQDDSIPVDELQNYYLRGTIYLQHCENLLKVIEQKVIELDPENINLKDLGLD